MGAANQAPEIHETWGILRLKQAFGELLVLSKILIISVLLLILPTRRVGIYSRMLLAESISSEKEEASGAPDFVVHQPEEGENQPQGWKGKGKAVVAIKGARPRLAGLPTKEVTVDWTQYDPPEGLKELAGSNSDVVVQIMQESIDRVKARIIEEEERRKAEEEAKEQIQKEKIRQENETPENKDTSHTPLDKKPSENDMQLDASSLARVSTDRNDSHAPEAAKSKKRPLFDMFRRLDKIFAGGGSGTSGAAQHNRDISWGGFESSTQAAKIRFIPGAWRKIPTNSNGSPTFSVHPSIHSAEIECVSCLDDFSPKEVVKLSCHSYCRPCFQRLVYATCENEQQWPPKCCLNPISVNTITFNVGDELKKIYRDRAAEWNLPISERIYCSHSSCSIWVKPYEINRARNSARCSRGHWTCIICRGRQHEGDSCPQDRDMARTDELAEEEGWKRCYGCHAYVEHREACQHMTCRCGAEFCYVCGARWRTCACTMEQLVAIKAGAEERRQTRRDREALEEAEVQEALRLVAEFEREEARKAELLRQERKRLAEERRARLIEERIRQEGERQRAVEVKFLELREIFSNIHELQRIIVQRSHSKEEADIESQGTTALAEFKEKQKIEWNESKITAKAKLTMRENEFEREYVARVAEERRIENQYQFELEAYWSGRKDGAAKLEAAMKELKRRMDNSFRGWEKWRDNELEKYRFSIQEKLGSQEEHMQEAERKLVDSTREKQNAFLLRKAAELRWLDVVMEERDCMLTNMEADEIDNGPNVNALFDDDWLDDGSIDGDIRAY
ncbi:hypothetical protein F4776DRAFT_605448 [Hypoxylon sp. NC0597]|nr:hypothetical protein F4776DRAFT_605448 [Hypoxylon sp. NC0597]